MGERGEGGIVALGGRWLGTGDCGGGVLGTGAREAKGRGEGGTEGD